MTPTLHQRVLLEHFEKLAIGLAMALVLGVGFYWIGFENLAADQAGEVTPWITETALDRAIPFWPSWVWPYLTYFPLSFVPLVYCRYLPRFRRIAFSYVLTYGTGLITFALLPSRMDRPTFEVTGPTSEALALLYRVDPGYNIFPSLHVANAVLVALIVQRYASPWRFVVWGLAALITASTVLVKQHYVIDLPAGAALGAGAFFLCFRRLERRPGDPDLPEDWERTRDEAEATRAIE